LDDKSAEESHRTLNTDSERVETSVGVITNQTRKNQRCVSRSLGRWGVLGHLEKQGGPMSINGKNPNKTKKTKKRPFVTERVDSQKK